MSKKKTMMVKLGILLASALVYGAEMLKDHFEEVERKDELRKDVNELVDARIAEYLRKNCRGTLR